MSLRAAPGRQDVIERALPEDLAAFLRRIRARLDLGENWQAVKPLGELLTTIALLEEATRIQGEEGCSETRAREAAGARLGLSPETVRTRIERWFRASRKPCVSLNAENGRRGHRIHP